MPLVAVAGIDDPKRLPPSEVNRWYEVIRQDDPARAPLRGYLLLELFRATGIDVPPGSTNLPEAPPAKARLIMPPAATLQALAGRGRRAPPRRDVVAGVDRRRRDAAQRASSRRGRRHRAGAAPGRRGSRRRACSRSRRRSPTASEPAVKKKPTPPLSREARGLHRDAVGGARRLARTPRRPTAPISRTSRPFWRGASRSRSTADADALRAYLKSLDYVGMTPRTVARRLSVIRQFFRFLLAERLRDGRSGEHARFAAARPVAAQGAVARRGRPADRGDAQPRTAPTAAAWRPCWRSSTPPACASRSW